MWKSKCAYCGHTFDDDVYKRTHEHVIPHCVVKLFPEQNIVLSVDGAWRDVNGQTTKDVCKFCNSNILSALDGYGVDLIKSSFHYPIPYSERNNLFPVTFDYPVLAKWVLKIAYNYSRVLDLGMEDFGWLKQYILSDSNSDNDDKFLLYAGMHIDVSPMPEECFGYMPMQYSFAPAVFGISLPVSHRLGIPSFDQRSGLWGINPTFLLRLGNAIFYCVLWHPKTDEVEKHRRRELAHVALPFVRISNQKKLYNLKRVTACSNIINGYGHILTINALDGEDSIMSTLFAGRSVSDKRSEFDRHISKEWLTESRKLVERIILENNNKK